MNGQYEVLNPWAEADPKWSRGISPRVPNLAGRTIGLFAGQMKVSARPILTVVEKGLKEKFPTLKFSWFLFDYNLTVTETEDKGRFEDWTKGIDAAIAAVGD